MNWEWTYYIWVFLLLVANCGAWLSSFVMLPGNWIIAGLTAVFAFFFPSQDGPGVGWTTVLVLLALAALGEAIEFAAGSAGAARQGASRRSMALALVGAMVGSIAGAILLVALPVIGPITGALAGGGAGAFGGAYLGECWKGKSHDESLSAGRGAFVGRLLGTVGKSAVGAVMVAVAAADSLF